MTTPAKPRTRPATARAGGRGARSPGETGAAAKRPTEATTRSVGRPCTSTDGLARTLVVYVRVSPAELGQIETAAAAAGMGAAEYLRSLAVSDKSTRPQK